jgi:hypothetical protein
VDEKRPERLLIFELRNGPEIPAKTILRRAQGWVEAILTLPTLMRQQEELQAQARKYSQDRHDHSPDF